MRLVVRQLNHEQVRPFSTDITLESDSSSLNPQMQHLRASMEEDDSIETFNSGSIHIIDHASTNGTANTTTHSTTTSASSNATDAHDKMSKKEQRKEVRLRAQIRYKTR